MVAGSIVELSNVTIESIIMPTLEPVLKKRENYVFTIGSININLEKFIKSGLKLIILTTVIYLLFRFGVNIDMTSSIKPKDILGTH